MPERTGKQFGVLKNYTKFLKDNFSKTKRMMVGNFYTFTYWFEKDQDFNTIKYYDFMPLIFFFGINEKHKNLYQGINFHHLPLQARKIYMEKMKSLVTEDFDNDRRLVRLARYTALFKMFRKATKFSTRQYEVANMRDIRKIPNTMVEEALQYYAKTYYGINISNVEKKYLAFRI
jgi:hypothetical protein